MMTTQLKRLQTGDSNVMNDVVPMVYDELKKLARAHLRREAQPGALETIGLVHEAFLKLTGIKHPDYENRAHFFGIASRLMRQILVDYARARHAKKRGAAVEVAVDEVPEIGARQDPSLLVLEDALRQLERTDLQKARLIEMRYFGGMTAEECSEALSIPAHKVRRELRLAQAWLRREMTENSTPQNPTVQRDGGLGSHASICAASA